MQVIKEIISRLDNNRCTVCIYDCEDDSRILIDPNLKDLMKMYYEDLLKKKEAEYG